MSEEILLTNEMRLRIIDLEYQDLSGEELAREIKRIYLEVEGEEFPAEIDVYQTGQNADYYSESGYKGSAVRFYSEENDIEEVYIISEGSQTAQDWEYNARGIFAGLDYSQAEHTHDFTKEALEKFGYENVKHYKDYEIPVIGLGHSLANNNNVTAHLAFDTFTEVYGVNGAQASFYQLYHADKDFQKLVKKEYPGLYISPKLIYQKKPEDIERIARNHYEDKFDNIYQEISENDLLHWVSGTRGFFEIGNIKYYKTNDNFDGLRDAFDNIPDEFVKDIQLLTIHFFNNYEKPEDLNKSIEELIGLDMEFLSEIEAKDYIFNHGKFEQMIKDVHERLPSFLNLINQITKNSDAILNELVKNKYITLDQKVELAEALETVEKELLVVEKNINDLVTTYDLSEATRYVNRFDVMAIELSTAISLYYAGKNIVEAMEKLDHEAYMNILEEIVHDHSIYNLLAALDLDDGKKYIDGDLHYSASYGGQEIWVNISNALHMYSEGIHVLDEKEEYIKDFKELYEKEILRSEEHTSELKS